MAPFEQGFPSHPSHNKYVVNAPPSASGPAASPGPPPSSSVSRQHPGPSQQGNLPPAPPSLAHARWLHQQWLQTSMIPHPGAPNIAASAPGPHHQQGQNQRAQNASKDAKIASNPRVHATQPGPSFLPATSAVSNATPSFYRPQTHIRNTQNALPGAQTAGNPQINASAQPGPSYQSELLGWQGPVQNYNSMAALPPSYTAGPSFPPAFFPSEQHNIPQNAMFYPQLPARSWDPRTLAMMHMAAMGQFQAPNMMHNQDLPRVQQTLPISKTLRTQPNVLSVAPPKQPQMRLNPHAKVFNPSMRLDSDVDQATPSGQKPQQSGQRSVKGKGKGKARASPPPAIIDSPAKEPPSLPSSGFVYYNPYSSKTSARRGNEAAFQTAPVNLSEPRPAAAEAADGNGGRLLPIGGSANDDGEGQSRKRTRAKRGRKPEGEVVKETKRRSKKRKISEDSEVDGGRLVPVTHEQASEDAAVPEVPEVSEVDGGRLLPVIHEQASEDAAVPEVPASKDETAASQSGPFQDEFDSWYKLNSDLNRRPDVGSSGTPEGRSATKTPDSIADSTSTLVVEDTTTKESPSEKDVPTPENDSADLLSQFWGLDPAFGTVELPVEAEEQEDIIISSKNSQPLEPSPTQQEPTPLEETEEHDLHDAAEEGGASFGSLFGSSPPPRRCSLPSFSPITGQ